MSNIKSVYHKQNIFKSCTLALALVSSLIYSNEVSADVVHKGLNFKGLIKTASGQYLTRTGLTVNLKVLSPNNCVLKEEQFNNVSMNEGSLQLVIGQGSSVGSSNLEISKILDNSDVSFTGLTCLNSDGTTDGNTTTYTSSAQDLRKVRVSLNIDSVPVVGTFNLRAVAYAVNAESLEGKSKNDFIQVSTKVTQTTLEDFFNKITSAAGSFVKWNGTDFTTLNISDFTQQLSTCSGTMRMIGSGRSAYCIDTVPRGPNSFLGAHDVCRTAGYELCSFSEWSYACSKSSNSASEFYNAQTSVEWVSDPATSPSTSALVVGGGTATSCISHSSSSAMEGATSQLFRCCAH